MPQNIERSKNIFFFLYAFIFFLSVSVCFFFLGLCYINQSLGIQREDLSNTLAYVVRHLRETKELPQERIPAQYLTFAVDQNSAYIFERKELSGEDSDLWKQYYKKLLYQMQKQKRGWISYPLRKPWNIFLNTHIIRYTTMDELGWVVAVEAPQQSEWSLFQRLFSSDILLLLLSLMALGIAFLRIGINLYTKNIKGLLSTSIEEDYLSFENELGSLKHDKKNARLNKNPKEVIKAYPAEPEDIKKPSTVIPHITLENPFEAKLTQNSALSLNQPTPVIPSIQSNVLKEPAPYPAPKTPFKPSAPELTMPQQKPEAPKPPASLDKMTIEIEGIKSPILKKLLKQMRNEKN